MSGTPARSAGAGASASSSSVTTMRPPGRASALAPTSCRRAGTAVPACRARPGHARPGRRTPSGWPVAFCGQFAVAKGQPVQRLQHGRADAGFDRVGHEAGRGIAEPGHGPAQADEGQGRQQYQREQRCADAFQAMQQSSRMLAVGARQRQRKSLSWVSKTAPSGRRWRGGRWRRCGWTSAVRRAQARAAWRRRPAAASRRAAASAWRHDGRRRRRNSRPGVPRSERGGVAKAFKLAEFAAEASGRLVLARYQFVQRARPARSRLRQIPVAARAGIGQRQGENGGQHAGNHQPQVHRWRESALRAMAAGRGQVAEDFLAQAGAVVRRRCTGQRRRPASAL